MLDRLDGVAVSLEKGRGGNNELELEIGMRLYRAESRSNS
jgi:hypothetical protein